MPEVYGQKVQHDVRSENVVRVVGPTFARDANAQPKQLPAPKETDSELVRDLKARLAAKIANPVRSVPDGPVQKFKADDEPSPARNAADAHPPKVPLQDHPRAYQADPITETVKTPTLDYGRTKPPANIGRGTVEPGGYNVTNRGTYR